MAILLILPRRQAKFRKIRNHLGLPDPVLVRHGRARPGHPRLPCCCGKDVDARDKPGHDEFCCGTTIPLSPVGALWMNAMSP
jgi:hypothetical protein